MTLVVPRAPLYLLGPVQHLPARVVDNEALVSWMGHRLRPSWIEHRTGIRERRWVVPGEALSDLASAAAEALLAKYGLDRGSIPQLLLATVSGDYPSPPTGPLVLSRVGLGAASVVDLAAACAGFVAALMVGATFTEVTGDDQLLIAADIRSPFLNKDDFSTCVLFGDGAAAALLTSRAERASFRVRGVYTSADPSLADLISIPAGGTRLPYALNDDPRRLYLTMKSAPELFLKGVELMAGTARALLERLELTPGDIQWLVPHQANLHLMKAVADKLGIAHARMVSVVETTGNTAGASVGLALAQLREEPRLRPGDKILLTSSGAGGGSASALLEAVSVPPEA